MESSKKINTRTKWLSISLSIIILLGLLYAVFQKDIQERGEGLERIWERQDNYKAQNPNTTDGEVKEAFEEWIENIKKREDNYKASNPNATDAEVKEAFDAARGK